MTATSPHHQAVSEEAEPRTQCVQVHPRVVPKVITSKGGVFVGSQMKRLMKSDGLSEKLSAVVRRA